MLTLLPGSACDVCAEEYGSHRLPHSIPCGHVLCASCCTTIVDKTSPRSSPSCPFCRVHFTADSIRMIRMDFSTSGWSTPRRFPTVEANSSDFASEILAQKTERLLLPEGGSRTRQEARRLEDKVAKVAAKKCSFEEVSTLHKELEAWLMSDTKDDHATSLYLSAALLRAIIMNHLAHSDASKNAKTVEANLKGKLDDMEITNGKLESELRRSVLPALPVRQRLQYSQKSQECQQLRTEVSQLKALATTLGLPASDSRAQSPTSPTPSPTPPVSPYGTSTQSPLSRFNGLHVRSASMSSRPTTPATPTPARSHTPALPLRSHTPSLRSQTPSLRSQTPSIRSHTPVPPVPRLTTPAPSLLRMQTPVPPPPIPPKPRRLSHSSPPKMARSTSEEKADAHERWIPPPSDPDYPDYSPSSKAYKYASARPPSRAAFGISSLTSRWKDVRSPSPS